MPQPTDEQVASVPLFQRLSPEDRRLIASAAEVRRYQPDELIFAEGEPSSAMLMILSGRVRIVRSGAHLADATPEIIDAGDPLGAAAAYDGGPFTASGMAIETTECLVISRMEFFRLLEESPTLVRSLVLSLMHQIIELRNELRR